MTFKMEMPVVKPKETVDPPGSNYFSLFMCVCVCLQHISYLVCKTVISFLILTNAKMYRYESGGYVSVSYCVIFFFFLLCAKKYIYDIWIQSTSQE